MTDLILKSPPAQGFEARLEGTGPTLRLVFEGTAEAAAKEVLAGFLKKADEAIVRDGAAQVAVDFTKLQFMTSSCFKDLVTWLAAIKARPAEQQYKLGFISNPATRWQRASLHSLSCFALDLVTIDGK